LVVLPGSALAAHKVDQLVACVGGSTDNGTFSTQKVSLDLSSTLGIGISEPMCVHVGPAALVDATSSLISDLRNSGPGIPTAASISALLTELEAFHPTSVFDLVTLAFDVCDALNATNTCDGAISAAFLAAGQIPLGDTELTGTGGSCFFPPVQTGNGFFSPFGPGFYNINSWSANYSSGVLGVMTGVAQDSNGLFYQLNGAIGPFCGGGAKALVYLLH
jgi:hypothetical protein